VDAWGNEERSYVYVACLVMLNDFFASRWSYRSAIDVCGCCLCSAFFDRHEYSMACVCDNAYELDVCGVHVDMCMHGGWIAMAASTDVR
jgi:hypothetical protein